MHVVLKAHPAYSQHVMSQARLAFNFHGIDKQAALKGFVMIEVHCKRARSMKPRSLRSSQSTLAALWYALHSLQAWGLSRSLGPLPVTSA